MKKRLVKLAEKAVRWPNHVKGGNGKTGEKKRTPGTKRIGIDGGGAQSVKGVEFAFD